MERIAHTIYKNWTIVPEFIYSGGHQGIADFHVENSEYEKALKFPRTTLMDIREWIDEKEEEKKLQIA